MKTRANTKRKIVVCYGTRPEAIKMMPVIQELRKIDLFDVVVVSTGQHNEMLEQVHKLFNIKPDYDLQVMNKEKSTELILTNIIADTSNILKTLKPALVIVHGDTMTTLGSTLAAYYNRIPIAHVEAGLRTQNIYSPWPEEGNRRIVAPLVRYHFAPTNDAKLNLVAENIEKNNIFVTGNTVIDAVLKISNLIDNNDETAYKLNSKFKYMEKYVNNILVTFHRRENFDTGLRSICKSLNELANRHNDLLFTVPVHMNPIVQQATKKYLSDLPNIKLLKPQDYLSFIYLMKKSTLILSDSGGVQEEAPVLGTPVLLMRDTSERPEAIRAGGVRLIGTNSCDIIEAVTNLLEAPKELDKMVHAASPYGDGTAASRVTKVLERELINE